MLADVARMINQSVAPVAARVGVNENALVGLPQTRQVVNELVNNVGFLLAHAANASACAADGLAHAGNGTCVEVVPQCPRPSTPASGTMTLSNAYIIPGTTATYECFGDRKFLVGPRVRTCNHTSQQFDGADPQCLTCAVVNCLQCAGSTSNCALCAPGYDLIPGPSAQCAARTDTVVVMGGQVGGTR